MMQVWLNIQESVNITHHINRIKKQTHMIISADGVKTMQKKQNSPPTHVKTFRKIGNGGGILNVISSNYSTPTVKLKLSDKRLNAFPLRSVLRQGGLPLSLLFSVVH